MPHHKPAPVAAILAIGAALIALAIAASATGRELPPARYIPIDDFAEYLYTQESVSTCVTEPEYDPQE
jgi:hypothetical protein